MWPIREGLLIRALAFSALFAVSISFSLGKEAFAAEDPFDLRLQLEREAGIVPRRESIRSGQADVPYPSSGAPARETMISVDDEPEEEPPIRLRLVRGANIVEVVRGDEVIRRFPVSVGKSGWETPLGVFRVLQMELNPEFRNPFNVSDVRPAGSPRNPLGPAWIGFWSDGKGTGIGFHGTNLPQLQPSHGCVRMHNHHVTELYRYVSVGTLVEVVR